MLKYGRSNPITYSQCFIAKRHLAETLVNKIPCAILEHYSVIEIGPGTGRLTEFIIQIAKELMLIEIDYNFWRKLKEVYKNNKNVQVICGDFMDFQLPEKPYVVISNLPYFLARTMIMKLIKGNVQPIAMYLIMQDKLVHELEREQLKLGIRVQVLTKLDRKDFVPMPRVESLFVEIVMRK